MICFFTPPVWSQSSSVTVKVFCKDELKIQTLQTSLADHPIKQIQVHVHDVALVSRFMDQLNQRLPNEEKAARHFIKQNIQRLGGETVFKAYLVKQAQTDHLMRQHQIQSIPSVIIEQHVYDLPSCDRDALNSIINGRL